MKEHQNLEVGKSWPLVVEKIKEKYEQYCIEDSKNYRAIPFNSTPDHYGYLVKSFKKELSLLLGKSEAEVKILIPSESTFAKIYRTSYEPTGEKLHGCYLYATGKSKIAFENELRGNETSDTYQLETITASKTPSISRFAIRIGLISLIVISIYVLSKRQGSSMLPSGLIIQQPTNGKTVPMEVFAEGKVTNADTVWVVVRFVGSVRYWVQSPIKVQPDGTWKGPIYIGSTSVGDLGLRSQIRVFVNPVKPLRADQILYSWPEAQLSSKHVEVVREFGNTAHATGLVVSYPTNGKIVPRQLLAEGNVSNARVIWFVVRNIKSSQYWVQPPIKVEPNGKWRGELYIGSEAKDDIGMRLQVRAFANPVKSLKEGERLRSWPEAELSSSAIEVIRGQ